MSNAIVKRTADVILAENREKFLAVLPANVNRERFLAVAIAICKDRNLAECSDTSKLDSVYRIAKLGLDPDPVMGEAYVLPRKIKGLPTACFQPGYRGLTKLARNSRGISDIHAEVVYDNEAFSVALGTSRQIVHTPWYANGAEGPGSILCAYVTWRDATSGEVNFHVVNIDRINRARAMNRGRDGNDSKPWTEDPAAMARKTAIIDASKLWPLSAEMADAVDSAERIERDEPQSPVIPAGIIGEESPAAKSELDDFIGCGETQGGEDDAPSVGLTDADKAAILAEEAKQYKQQRGSM